MDIVVTGRHLNISDRYREHIEEKLGKITQLEPRTRRVEVMVSHEPNRRQAKACDRVEVTCYAKGPVVRAEACADDKYAALDVVVDKLMERLRRRSDRRQVHRGRRTPESVARATARVEAESVVGAPELDTMPEDGPFGDSPIEVREKVHRSTPMTLSDALAEMEAVGHDFFLFHDADTDRASVLYRRRGWSYGVLHLDLDGHDESGAETGPSDRVDAAAS
ncbi:ribosome-associated translation inhibitor RaiA [Nostocoides sp. Soil756]|uniref:ribosome hibernation-promoting factor, HPF/YfiA family n=1 Tax=Nostocoides sp. Soil756 TaxID=1736399 RepID=UPI0006F477CA|nr:ribosome-associated translation inhibitor RaiA [Tetrasphaera sp. Soil756]KRE62304.1 30S ribosomal protein S30 [Tetrasphaera sp. Soil756]